MDCAERSSAGGWILRYVDYLACTYRVVTLVAGLDLEARREIEMRPVECQVAGAPNRSILRSRATAEDGRCRVPFRCRDSRRESAVSQLFR